MGGKMRGGSAACDFCTKNCAIVHKRKGGTSSDVDRFFKFMHGKTYDTILYLPPKFARTVKDLVGQEAQIEDVNGDKSRVNFSEVDGSLVFKEGWANFFSAHHLEFGDLLVFNYMKKGHFIVQIYDTSACEKSKFSPRRPVALMNKRPRLHQDEPPLAVDVNPMDKPSSPVQCISGSNISKSQSQIIRKNVSDSNGDLGKAPLQLVRIYQEDPLCMLTRDDSYPKEDRSVLDLSMFEMKKTISSVCNIEKSSNDTEMINCPPDGFLIDHADETMIDNTGFIQDGDRILATCRETPSLSCIQVADQETSMPNFCSVKQSATIKNMLVKSNNTGSPSLRSSQVPKQENAFMPKSFSSSILGLKPPNELVLSRDNLKPSGKQSATIKNKLMGSNNTGSHSIRSTQVPKQENAFMPKSFASSILGPKRPNELVPSSDKMKPSGLVDSRDNAKASGAESLHIQNLMPDNVSSKQDAVVKEELMESREEVHGLHQISEGNGHVSTRSPPFYQESSLLNPRVSSILDYASKTSAAESSPITNLTRGMKQATPFKESVMDVNVSRQTSKEHFAKSGAVKVEPDLSNDSAQPSVPGYFSTQVQSNSYLVLRVSIPVPRRKRKWVVYLKNESGTWPVLYHDMLYARAFTGHWRSFCEANHVKSGDICEFHPQSHKSCILYEVRVIHKSG